MSFSFTAGGDAIALQASHVFLGFVAAEPSGVGSACYAKQPENRLCSSPATGTPFLDKFHVGRARRVVLFSGESGEATLQETCRRIAWSMGWDLADVPNFTLITDVPQLDNDADLAALELVIDGAEVVALDPAYLMMPGGDAGNLFIQGAMLLKLSRLC
ncbi:MAG: hypothetical protein H0T51_06650 [Pirellulales bacterium]|nr:hypothetical protein [Pirellulales bacterium]